MYPVIILTYVVTIINYKFHEHYLICVLFFPDFFLPVLQASETNLNVDGIIASTIGEIQISIGDLNDNGPEFYECEGEPESCTQKNSFIGKVDEHSSAGLSVNELNIRVKDPDQVCSYKCAWFLLRRFFFNEDYLSFFPMC